MHYNVGDIVELTEDIRAFFKKGTVFRVLLCEPAADRTAQKEFPGATHWLRGSTHIATNSRSFNIGAPDNRVKLYEKYSDRMVNPDFSLDEIHTAKDLL